MTEPIELFVIYEHPLDYPHSFVVRRHLAGPPEYGPDGTPDPEPMLVCQTIDEARAILIPRGLVPIGRMEDDVPCIHEVWV